MPRNAPGWPSHVATAVYSTVHLLHLAAVELAVGENAQKTASLRAFCVCSQLIPGSRGPERNMALRRAGYELGAVGKVQGTLECPDLRHLHGREI
jgi:hypothetical protein